ncbi:MAG: hypothetical protein V4694_04820 [Pseudomonadota bacterium]
MPVQNLKEVSNSYPSVIQIKEAIPCADFEIVEVDGQKKLKLHLDFTAFAYLSLQDNYGYSFENLPPEIRSALDEIKIAEVKCILPGESAVKTMMKNSAALLPKIKDFTINNVDQNNHNIPNPLGLPVRFYDKFYYDFKSEPELNYPERTIQTFPHAWMLELEKVTSALKEVTSTPQDVGIEINFNFNPENHSDILEFKLTEEHLWKIKTPLSLRQASVFAAVKTLTFKSNFENPETFREQLTRLTELFPAIDNLQIGKIYRKEGPHSINQDFDFSQVTKFKKLKSLQLPITAIGDYHFLNDVENLAELALSPPLNGSDFARSSASINNLISHIEDNKSEQVKKLRLPFYPLDQKTFDRLCKQFDAVEDLTVNTVTDRDLVQNFDALLLLQNLRKLSIDNLVLKEGRNLEKLRELKLDNPNESTLDNFGHTSERFGNLEKLVVNSSYETSASSDPKSWNLFFKGFSHLPNLSDLHLSRQSKKPFENSSIEIDPSFVDYLSKTNLSKLFITGLILPETILPPTFSYSYSKNILKLVDKKRAEKPKESVEDPSGGLVSNHQLDNSKGGA